ncbi:uncharacterized protein LOC107781931 [Nicotiana tabacum]|uniref:Uncharacterized protein LOC107781931 n=3 Tax=Nicotiana TaxID=4085 RepID=A0AC58UH64_TOBAC|nr:PREDICTED: uncharacterized protein LOC104239570 [Nicotiana sylvestris]XP_009792533.1 PREDICTED: uncharacterized protein LOC104239570 [Nicotiana sylvestris]XP_016458237.1 PREDICTED: uncharacterized protein LOC107781931 [Nicotiana tabacum]
MSTAGSRHLLRLRLSCRKITAQVTTTTTDTIVAMASSSEQEFAAQCKARLNRVPRFRNLWDAKISSRVGEKLGDRLNEVKVYNVEIDVEEEVNRPVHYRKMVAPLFESVKGKGIAVVGADKLGFF